MYSNCNLFPGIFPSSLSLLVFNFKHVENETLIPSHLWISLCCKLKRHFQFPPQNVKTSFKWSLGQSHREWVICIHSSAEHHQTGNREVFTALPGGCATTGFSHSRQTEWGDCRGRWEQDGNYVWLRISSDGNSVKIPSDTSALTLFKVCTSRGKVDYIQSCAVKAEYKYILFCQLMPKIYFLYFLIKIN